MSNPEDIDALAAEFTLGTLDPDERRGVAARRLAEPALDAAIAAWELRLGPLAETVPSVAPPNELFGRIEARITGGQGKRIDAEAAVPVLPAMAQSADSLREIIVLRRRLSQWRMRAVGFGAIAATFALGIGLREWTRPAAPKSYVAVLQKDGFSTAFLLSVDLEARAFSIRPVVAQPEPGKSFELWLIDSKLGAKSLGVVGDQPVTTRASLAVYDRVTVAGATYAVTVEPPGGSPNGIPTGPVVFSGQLVQTGP